MIECGLLVAELDADYIFLTRYDDLWVTCYVELTILCCTLGLLHIRAFSLERNYLFYTPFIHIYIPQTFISANKTSLFGCFFWESYLGSRNILFLLHFLVTSQYQWILYCCLAMWTCTTLPFWLNLLRKLCWKLYCLYDCTELLTPHFVVVVRPSMGLIVPKLVAGDRLTATRVVWYISSS